MAVTPRAPPHCWIGWACTCTGYIPRRGWAFPPRDAAHKHVELVPWRQAPRSCSGGRWQSGLCLGCGRWQYSARCPGHHLPAHAFKHVGPRPRPEWGRARIRGAGLLGCTRRTAAYMEHLLPQCQLHWARHWPGRSGSSRLAGALPRAPRTQRSGARAAGISDAGSPRSAACAGAVTGWCNTSGSAEGSGRPVPPGALSRTLTILRKSARKNGCFAVARSCSLPKLLPRD